MTTRKRSLLLSGKEQGEDKEIGKGIQAVVMTIKVNLLSQNSLNIMTHWVLYLMKIMLFRPSRVSLLFLVKDH